MADQPEKHVGERMLDRLIETVKVEVFLTRVGCPNKDCTGVLEFDGKTRSINGVHGGPVEYRHLCTKKCGCGVWMGDKYPKTEYREVPSVVIEQVVEKAADTGAGNGRGANRRRTGNAQPAAGEVVEPSESAAAGDAGAAGAGGQ